MNTNFGRKPYDIAVVGGGPAGLMAALHAAEFGKSIVLLEKNKYCGRKLALAGGGRGNFTHAADRQTLQEAFPDKAQQRFLRAAFTAFDAHACMAFFADLGVPYKIEADAKVYPRSNRAEDLVDALEKRCLSLGVSFLYENAATDIRFHDKQGFEISLASGRDAPARTLLSKVVILTTGGKSFPHTGSNGDGYRLAQAFGHQITPLRPALLSINLEEAWLAELSGLSVEDAALSLAGGKKKQAKNYRGVLLFTHFGLSGPLALDFSRELDETNLSLVLDFLPALTILDLRERLAAFCFNHAKKQAKSFFLDYLPQRLAEVLAIHALGVDAAQKHAAHSSKAERERIITALKALELQLGKTRPFAQAMLTRGGVALDEVKPKTMESRLQSGLYFAGEILDIDGPSGGYNLQAAFATGRLAAQAATKAL